MLTTDKLNGINERLEAGEKPEDVAADFNVTLSGLRYQLYNSGKKIEIFRRLVDTAPSDEEKLVEVTR
jgi:hypothetical protein